MGRPGEPRKYGKEYKSYHAKPAQKKKRAARNAARKKLEARTGKPLSPKTKGKSKKGQVETGHTKRGAKGSVKRQSVKSNRGWRKGKSGYK
jgi:hypothetical protein